MLRSLATSHESRRLTDSDSNVLCLLPPFDSKPVVHQIDCLVIAGRNSRLSMALV